jgi:hypothetical protein
VQLYLSTLQRFEYRPEVMDEEVAACLVKLDGILTRYDDKGCIHPHCSLRKLFRKLRYNVWGTINKLHDIAQQANKVTFDMNPLTPTFKLMRDDSICVKCQNLAIMLFQVAYVIEN